MPRAHVCTPGGGDPTVKSPALPQRPSLVLSSDASFPVTIIVEYLFFSFPFQFRASDKIAKRKKVGCSCKTPGLLMRRPLSIPDLSGQHRTSLPTSPLPPQQAGGILGAIPAPVFWLQPPVICNVYSVRFHLSGDFIVCWKVWLCPSWK